MVSSTEVPRNNNTTSETEMPGSRSVASMEHLRSSGPNRHLGQRLSLSQLTPDRSNNRETLIHFHGNALEREIERLKRENDRLSGLVNRMGDQIGQIHSHTGSLGGEVWSFVWKCVKKHNSRAYKKKHIV